MFLFTSRHYSPYTYTRPKKLQLQFESKRWLFLLSWTVWLGHFFEAIFSIEFSPAIKCWILANVVHNWFKTWRNYSNMHGLIIIVDERTSQSHSYWWRHATRYQTQHIDRHGACQIGILCSIWVAELLLSLVYEEITIS